MHRVTALLLATLLPACTLSSTLAPEEGMMSVDGRPFAHLTTTAYGVHFLMAPLPLFGDGTLEHALEAFAREAREAGATGMRIVQSDTTVYWWVLPPLSFFFPLVRSNVAGDVMLDVE